MTKKRKSDVTIKIGGTKYVLKATMRTLVEVMDALEVSGLGSLIQKVKNPTPKIIYTALRITSKAGGLEMPAEDFMQCEAIKLTDGLETVSQVLFGD